MTSLKVRLGDCIREYNQACGTPDLTANDVSGINRDKEFFEPSRQVGGDTSKYKLVPDGFFACNLMHVGRDAVLPIALNHSGASKVVSPAYTVFEVLPDASLLPEYFFIMLKSPQRDRYFWMHTDASIRDGMAWQDFCDVEFELPSMEVQKRYVRVYQGISVNLAEQETIAMKSRSAFEIAVERLRTEYPAIDVGKYITPADLRNKSRLGLESVRGISIDKVMIPTKANMKGVSLSNYKVVKPGEIAFVPVTSRNGGRMSIAINSSPTAVMVSSINQVFACDSSTLLPEYLMLFLSRPQFDRYARFHSWGSARETFNWDDMCAVRIPVPPVDVQRSVVALATAHSASIETSKRSRELLRDLCPVLIKGSLDEARREEAAA